MGFFLSITLFEPVFISQLYQNREYERQLHFQEELAEIDAMFQSVLDTAYELEEKDKRKLVIHPNNSLLQRLWVLWSQHVLITSITSLSSFSLLAYGELGFISIW